MQVYLDNAATTQAMEPVVEKVCELLRDKYGNPSSLHYKGMESEREVSKAKNILSSILKVEKTEIYFTSGGTESNNLALFGIARAYKRSGRHIIVSGIEHPSVSAAIKALEAEEFEVTYLPVLSSGVVDTEFLGSAIRKDTILVSIMHVNNEIGTIQPLEAIGKLIKSKNSKTIFHVDAVQSFGKLRIFPKRWQIDCLSFSGHKIYAPKGIGGLYVATNVKILPILFGGSQQTGLRSGTENTSGIAALGVASEILYQNLEDNTLKMKGIKERLKTGLLSIEGVFVNGPEGDLSAPHILNMRFDNIKGEVLLHALESEGIFVSTGSACASNKPDPSPTLKAIGLSNLQIDNSIRFSFSIYNTEEEIDYCIEKVQEIVPKLRKFVRK